MNEEGILGNVSNFDKPSTSLFGKSLISPAQIERVGHEKSKDKQPI